MANQIQVTMDAASPRALGAFWQEVLGYVEEPPPPGFDTWEEALDSFGIDRSDPDAAFAIVDPDGAGPRMFFAKVPEPKSAKNRVHLDVNVGKDTMHERSQHLVSLGAELVGEYEEPGGHWITLRDPEGNEFCLQ